MYVGGARVMASKAERKEGRWDFSGGDNNSLPLFLLLLLLGVVGKNLHAGEALAVLPSVLEIQLPALVLWRKKKRVIEQM